MSLPEKALQALNEHWAVAAIGADSLARAQVLTQPRRAQQETGRQTSFSGVESAGDETFLERVGLAFELAAIEGLEALGRPAGDNQRLREQAVAVSFRVFDIRRLLPVPAETLERLFFVLQLSAVACCGERRADLRRWYREQEDALTVPGIAEAGWGRRLLYRLFDCWVRLFRKDERDDLDPVCGIIAGLRNDQAVYEERYLKNDKNDSERVNRAFAFRLVALYHWAAATETLARYMLQGKPGEKYPIERVVEKPGLWELVGCRVALSPVVFLA